MEKEIDVNKTLVIESLWWKVLERLTSQGLNLFIQILLARILLPEDFGNLAVITAIIGYLTVFVQAGLSTVIIQKSNLENKDVSTLLVSSLFISFFLYIIVYFISPFISYLYHTEYLVWPLRIQSIALFLGAINSIQVALFSRIMQFKAIFYRSILSVPISGLIGIIMAINGFGIWALIVQNLSSYIITIIYMSLNPITHVKMSFSWGRALKMYSFSGKILLSGLVSTTGDTLRTMLIGKKYTASTLGYYDKGYSYSSLFTQIVTLSISSVMLPAFSRKQDEKDHVLMMARRSVSIISFFMIPFLFGIIGIAEPLVNIMLTDKWALCVPYLMIFCFLRIPGCITNIDKQVYLGLGNSSVGLYYETILLGVNIIILLYTISIGIMAVAIGATVIEYIGNFFLVVYSAHFYNYKIRERIHDTWKPIINSLIMLLSIYWINYLDMLNVFKLLIQVPLAVIVYFVCVIISKDGNIDYVRSLADSKIWKTKFTKRSERSKSIY